MSRRGILALAGGLLLVGLVLFLIFVDRTPEVRAPSPDTEEDVTLEPLPPAILGAPIVYDLGAILRDLEDAVPSTFGNLEERVPHPDRDRVHFAFDAERSPFEAEMRGDTARLTAVVTWRARAWYDPPVLPEVSTSCGTGDGDPPRAVITVRSPLTLDPNWVLRSEATVEAVEAYSEETRDRCRITLFNIDVTGTAMGAIRSALEGRASQIDDLVAEVDVRSRLQGVWHTLEEPVELTDDVWLLVNPQSVTRGRALGEGTVLTIEVGMGALPIIQLSGPPEEIRTDLPELVDGEVAEEATIFIEGRAYYPEASRILNREIAEREVELSGRLIRIREVTLAGIGGGRVSLEVAFEGAARGRLFLVGTPELDTEQGEVHVPDLGFDLATQNLLVGGVAWLAHDRLLEFLRERARLPVHRIMEPAGEQLDRGLNRDLSDEVRIEGEVLSSRLLEVKALREALILRAEAEARATLHVVQGG